MADALEPGLDFLVAKDDWRQCRFVSAPLPELAPGRALFRVDRFALTANNATYALAGDGLGYWRFFPAEPGFGRIPAMGFGDVVRSVHAHFGDQLKHSCAVGATHWQAGRPAADLPGPKPKFFFAPAQI